MPDLLWITPLDCGSSKTLKPGNSVVITSPNFPGKYLANKKCSWSITATEKTSTLSVKCTKFVVRKSTNCNKNSVEFSDGQDLSKKLCGKNNGRTLTTGTNALDVVFTSSKQKTAKGFKCIITASEPTTTTTTAATTPSTADTTTSTGNSDCESCGTVNRATRIVGGVVTEVNEYPWQVALVYAGTNDVFCGAALHNKRFIITAAHCGKAIEDYQIDVEVLLGAHDVTNEQPAPQRIAMDTFTNHPQYDNNNLDNDISILRLATEATLNDQVKPACLPDPSKDYSSVNAVTSGWGVTTEGGNQPSTLFEVEVPTVTNSECSASYGLGITDNMLCAGFPQGGSDACQGDSGGPLAVEDDGQWVLIGVVSWGYGCARPNYPGVYARVTQYINWIQELTAEGGSLCTGEGSQATTPTSQPAVTTVTTQAPVQTECACGVVNRPTRIVGGQETEIHEYPWQVALTGYGGSHPFCGASIISDRWILTAAHCTPGMSSTSVQVILGEHTWNIGGETSATQRLDIEQVVPHPQYNNNTQDNDIALIKVASTISFSAENKIAPVCLPTSSASNSFDNVDAIVSGWGTLTSGGNQPNSLNDVTVPTMSNAQCQQSYGTSAAITGNMICAGLQQGGKDSCQGDSGGPLVTGESSNSYMIQIGVVSFGIGCALPNYPGVYARVTEYLPWIASYTSGSGSCSPPVAAG